MEIEVKNLLTQEIVNKLIKEWFSEYNNLKLLGENENFVYQLDNSFIFRITHSSHRTKNLILAELDWINYLYENGINVSNPVISKNNSFIEIYDLSDSYFIACVFEKSVGEKAYINSITEINELSISSLGEMVGKLHNLSKDYRFKKYKRNEWYEEDSVLNNGSYLPSSEKTIINEIYKLKNKFINLPKSNDSYGLIHADIHAGNFFIKDDNIILFDFDDSCYHWYIYDIAIIIYSYVLGLNENEDKVFYGKKFANIFLESYFSINNLDNKWLKLLPDIFRFRELLLYDFIYKKWDFKNLNLKQKLFFDSISFRIKNNIDLIANL